MEDLETQQPEPIEAPETPESEVGQAVSPAQEVPEPEAAEAPEVTEATEPSEPTLLEDLLSTSEPAPPSVPLEDIQLRAVLEAIVYVAEEPLTLAQLASSLQQPIDQLRSLMDQLVSEFDKPEHGVAVREVAGGYKMTTKPEHHEAVRNFVKSLKPPLKLSLPALETLAVIAYKQPVTGPEIMEIRGVQGGGVIKTLVDRKLIAMAGRKNVIGKPILYKTTKEFLIQFGLKDLTELPSLKEFEEIRRMAFSDEPAAPSAAEATPETDTTPETETAPEVAQTVSPASAPEAPSVPPAPEPEPPGPEPDPAPAPPEVS